MGVFIVPLTSLKIDLMISKILTKRGLRYGVSKSLKMFLSSIIYLFIFSGKRKILILCYTWFRKIDDIFDDDELPPKGFSLDSYVLQKKSLISGARDVILPEDILFFRILDLCKKYNINLEKEINDMFLSMLFEKEHRNILVPRNELYKNMMKQDVAFFLPILKVIGQDTKFIDKYSGSFSRIDSLADMSEDLKRGSISIPLEDAQNLGMSAEKLINIKSIKNEPSILAWRKEETLRIKEMYKKDMILLSKNLKGFFSSLIIKKLERLADRSFDSAQ